MLQTRTERIWKRELCWQRQSCELISAVKKATVEDTSFANRTVKYIKENPTVGIWCRSGMIAWPSKDDPSVRMCIATVSDASHGNESEYWDDWEEVDPFRSRGAKVSCISDDRLGQHQCSVHFVGYSSVVQISVVNSAMKADTYLVDEVDASDLLRAGLADLHGACDRVDCEVSAAVWCQHVWRADCKSCHNTLQKPIVKTVSKRSSLGPSSRICFSSFLKIFLFSSFFFLSLSLVLFFTFFSFLGIFLMFLLFLGWGTPTGLNPCGQDPTP